MYITAATLTILCDDAHNFCGTSTESRKHKDAINKWEDKVKEGATCRMQCVADHVRNLHSSYALSRRASSNSRRAARPIK